MVVAHTRHKWCHCSAWLVAQIIHPDDRTQGFHGCGFVRVSRREHVCAAKTITAATSRLTTPLSARLRLDVLCHHLSRRLCFWGTWTCWIGTDLFLRTVDFVFVSTIFRPQNVAFVVILDAAIVSVKGRLVCGSTRNYYHCSALDASELLQRPHVDPTRMAIRAEEGGSLFHVEMYRHQERTWF